MVEASTKISPNLQLFENLAQHTQEVYNSLNFTSNLELKVDDPNDVDSVAHAKLEAERLTE